MKFKAVLFVTCLALLSLLNLQAEKVADFEELGQPQGLTIGNGYIYIQERTTIFVYSLKDFKFVNKFGKEGEGPRELKLDPVGNPLGVTPYKGKVYVSSIGKLSIYSKTGEYIKEFKVKPYDGFYPLGKNYVCLTTAPLEENSQKRVFALFLADENFKKGKILYKSDVEVGQNAGFEFPTTPFYPDVNGAVKLFVIAGRDGFAIDVFNTDGEKLYRIKKDEKGLKIPQSYKDKTMKWFKTAPNYKQYYGYFKSRISFKDYYPPIATIIVDKDTIYVLTNKFKKEQRECILLDLEGNEKKRVYLPIPESYGMDSTFHFMFNDHYLYKLEENIDDETWELYRIKI